MSESEPTETQRQRLAEFAGQSDAEPSQAPEQAPERRPHRRNIGKLERPGPRSNLIRLLAQGTRTMRELASMHDCAVSAIHQFQERHKEEIEARRQEDYNALSSVWIANKESRLLELSQLYQHLGDGEIDPDAVRAAKDLLRAAAEELGQIPNKTTVVQAQPFEVRLIDGNTQQAVDDTETEQPEGDEYDQGV